MIQQKEAFDGENVMTAISYLVNNKHKRKWPWWHTALDYTLTGFYLAVYIGVLVKLISLFL